MKNKAKLDELLKRVDKMTDEEPAEEFRVADSREGRFYRHDDRTRIALKVALITGRPLLMVGPPGCGKSSLMPYVARNLNLAKESYTVTEASEASDLLWSVDYIKRLNDATQSKDVGRDLAPYVEHGVLWRAFEPSKNPNFNDALGTIVLIDEIDKADSSFANSLLVAIGSLQFDVPPLKNSQPVKAEDDTVVLVIMTSNEERELPPALTRRCVTLPVEFPTSEELVRIVTDRWKWMDDPKFKARTIKLADRLGRGNAETPISTAEFLDLVQVLKLGGLEGKDDEDVRWQMVEELVLHRNPG